MKKLENISSVFKRCYGSVTAKKLRVHNDSSTDTCIKIKNLSANDIIIKNIRDVNIKVDIDNIRILNHQLPNMSWMPKMKT